MSDYAYPDNLELKYKGYIFFPYPPEEGADDQQIGIEIAEVFYDECSGEDVSLQGLYGEVEDELTRIGLVAVMENIYEPLDPSKVSYGECLKALDASPYFVRVPVPVTAGDW